LADRHTGNIPVWSKKYLPPLALSVGLSPNRVNLAVLNQQHQQLFDTVNELDQALRKEEGNAALDPILKKLVDYVLVHFAAEDALLQQHDSPGSCNHRAA
jgi:hemerythrin-like metal-binding protein